MTISLPLVVTGDPNAPLTKVGYDAEYHIGLVAFDSSAETAAANTTTLNLALAAMHFDGSFTFANGANEAGPLIYPIVFSGKTFYFDIADGPIQTTTRIGGCIRGAGGGGYEMLTPQFQTGGTYGGMKTRLVALNADGTQPFIRLRGTGFEISGLDLYGRDMADWDEASDKVSSLIEVEGRTTVTGRHLFSNVGFFEADCGIKTLAGYYSGGSLQADENHADLSQVINCEFFSLDRVFWSTNQQSIGWKFYNCRCENAGNNPPSETVVFDLEAGGHLTADNMMVNLGHAILLKVTDYSPHQANVDIRNFYWDKSAVAGPSTIYCTLVEFAGTELALPGPWWGWRVRIGGIIGESTKENFDYGRLMKMHQTMDNADVMLDLQNLPTAEFEAVGSGPWYTWQQDVGFTKANYQINEGTGTSVRDKFGRATAGTISGASWAANHNSKSGRALSFGTTTNYVNIPADTYNRAYANSTISLWLKLVSFRNGGVFSRVNSATNGLRAVASGSHLYLRESVLDHWDLADTGEPTHVTAGTWYHLAFTMGGDNSAYCYLNGAQYKSASSFTGGTWMNENTPLRLGAAANSFLGVGTDAADCVISDFRIYDFAMTSDQIAALYASQVNY